MVDNGYYLVGESRVFYNKVQAIIEATKSNLPISWIFHDSEFSKVNWTKEPELPISEYYKRRAIELRNEYDYLVLHYSGGNDSNQVLQSFLDAGLVLDEVAIRTDNRGQDVTDFSATNTFGGYPIPYNNIIAIKNSIWPALKISEINVADEIIKKSNTAMDIFENSLSMTAFNEWKHYDLILGTDKISESGKKVAHILGVDKPNIFLDSKGWHIKILDKLVSQHVATLRAYTDETFNIELFFWGKNCAELIAKQAHLLFNAVRQGIPYSVVSNRSREDQDIVARLIYNYKFATWRDQKGTSKTVINDHEVWWYSNTETQLYNSWRKNLEELNNNITQSYLHQYQAGGIKGFWGKHYYISYLT